MLGKRDCLWEDACVLVNSDVFVDEGKRHYFFQSHLSTYYQDWLICEAMESLFDRSTVQNDL